MKEVFLTAAITKMLDKSIWTWLTITVILTWITRQLEHLPENLRMVIECKVLLKLIQMKKDDNHFKQIFQMNDQETQICKEIIIHNCSSNLSFHMGVLLFFLKVHNLWRTLPEVMAYSKVLRECAAIWIVPSKNPSLSSIPLGDCI